MSYEMEFLEAEKRTREWGLEVPVLELTSARCINDGLVERVAETVQRVLGHLTPQQIAAQCFAVSSFLRPPLEEVLQIPLTYTLGCVDFGKGPVFHTPIEGLKRMLDTGVEPLSRINLHAWLTMPSMEILDFTLATTFGLTMNRPEMFGMAMVKHPDELVGDQSYHPQVIGEDFLRRVGVLLDINVVEL